MCRQLVYKGAPVLIGKVTHEPEHSLMNQAKNGGFYPGCHDPKQQRNMRVNGDGFGLAWYSSSPLVAPEAGACAFRCITPAWNNFNLASLVQHVESHLIFAHVRAVHGDYGKKKNDISEDNCHPFVYKRYIFMHNGDVSGFNRLKRKIRTLLPDALYDFISGSTDSEHAFALLLKEIGDCDRELSAIELADAVERTINRITAMQKANGIEKASSMNFAVSDGRHLVATRCRNHAEEPPPSLFYCLGEGCGEACGSAAAGTPDNPIAPGSVAISSEPLTRCPKSWVLLPSNHVIVVPYMPDGTCEAHIRALNIEDIRQDRPGVPPASPASSTYTVHRAGPEARERYEKRMASQKLKRDQNKRQHGLVA